MIKSVEAKLIDYDPNRHTIAVYTPTGDLAYWLASHIGLEPGKWFYVKSVCDLFGRQDLYLLFFGKYHTRSDFDECYLYWEQFMPPGCGHAVLDELT